MKAPGSDGLQQWRSKLEYSVYEGLGSMRIREMFDIVVDYPETRPALQDLKACLIHTSLHGDFISCFRQETEARLLHPGMLSALSTVGHPRNTFHHATHGMHAYAPAHIFCKHMGLMRLQKRRQQKATNW